MKKYFKISSLMLLMFSATLLFNGCSKDEDGGNPEGLKLNGIGYSEAERVNAPHMFTSLKDGSCLKIYETQETEKIDSIFFYDGNKMLGVKCDINEMPVKLYANDLLYVLTNYQGNSVTVSTYNNQGQRINEELVTNNELSEFTQMNARRLAKAWVDCFPQRRQPWPPKSIKAVRTLNMAVRLGFRPALIEEISQESLFVPQNAETLNSNFEQFATHHETGWITQDNPVRPQPPTPNTSLCDINGNWSGMATGSATTSMSVPGGIPIPPSTAPYSASVGFSVVNCNVQQAAEAGTTVTVSLSGNTVVIKVNINTNSNGVSLNVTQTYTGQLNAAKNKISGTYTLSMNSTAQGVTVNTSSNGNWEVTKQ